MPENYHQCWMVDDDGTVYAIWIEDQDTELCDREIDSKGQE